MMVAQRRAVGIESRGASAGRGGERAIQGAERGPRINDLGVV
jgi:hypothetical protein